MSEMGANPHFMTSRLYCLADCSTIVQWSRVRTLRSTSQSPEAGKTTLGLKNPTVSQVGGQGRLSLGDWTDPVPRHSHFDKSLWAQNTVSRDAVCAGWEKRERRGEEACVGLSITVTLGGNQRRGAGGRLQTQRRPTDRPKQSEGRSTG
jgi:hypothetical protein